MDKRIVIKNIIESDLAVSSEVGQKVLKTIETNIGNNISMDIDFTGIKSLTTAFLNVAIGELYKDRNREDLNKYVKIDARTLTRLQAQKVKMVMDNSREKYSTSLKKKIDEVALHGESN